MKQTEALEVLLSGENCFLTGDAGTGKSWTIQDFIKRSRGVGKNIVVVAPTGIAAINVGGATIHSTFKMFGNYLYQKPAKSQSVDWRHIDTIVIDEISMVGPDYVDYIDYILQRSTGRQVPFGGIQMIFVGDPAQLKPVYGTFTDQDKKDVQGLMAKYGQLTFDKAHSYKGFTELFLDEPQRSKDPEFNAILNEVRNGDMSALDKFKKGYGTDESVHLKPYNVMVDKHNQQEFDKLKGETHVYRGETEGRFNLKNCITPEILELKEHARIMVTKNMQNGLVNGDLGTVIKCENGAVTIHSDRLGMEVSIGQETWKEVTYDGVQEHVIGVFKQIPLKLSWAMTIHKSQGLSLEHVCLTYIKGMSTELAYVGVSRCTKRENLYINSQG